METNGTRVGNAEEIPVGRPGRSIFSTSMVNFSMGAKYVKELSIMYSHVKKYFSDLNDIRLQREYIGTRVFS